MTKTKEVKVKEYPIIKRKVLREGYTTEIDKVYFTIDPRVEEVVIRAGNPVMVVKQESAVYQSEAPLRVDEETGKMLGGIKANKGEFFTDLTKEQIRILAIAEVIEAPKEKKWYLPK